MATVYLATQLSLGRHVALKLLKKFDNPSQSKRFLQEGRVIASLNHRNVINIYDIGVTEDDRPYISMEYLEGGDLEERIKEGVNVDDALHWLEAIGNCLAFVHSKGIIHRDIKPGNILFHKDGTPILSDFGVAKQKEHDPSLTMDGLAFGSPYYISPEQAASKELDGRADIYGLGIVLYEMLTGDRPYKGDSHIETIAAHLSEPPPVLPQEFRVYQPLIQKMLAKSPDDRFEDADEMVRYAQKIEKPHVMEIGLFDSLRSGKILGRSKIALSERKRLHWVTASTLAIMLLAVAALLFKQETEEQTAEVPVTSLDTSVTDKPVTEKPVKKKPVETVSSESNSWLSSPPSLLDDKEQRIEELLSQAKTAIKEYRLSTPENDNAYDYYKQVLVLDPNNEDANDGINDIADKYADLVERELDQFDYFEADKYMVRGLAIQPDNPRLRALQKSTNALRDAPKRAYGKIKSIFD